jgi:hypothetical protein
MINVFLSVSVPLPGRHPRFMETADVIAIRDSVKALVSEVVTRGIITFGGHPAITPLIALLLKDLGPEAARRVVLYLSEYFVDEFIGENREFLDVRFIPAVPSRGESLELMRRHMIGDTKFDAGVFIGGMEGVLEEFQLFKERHPKAARWPIASTGAAAQDLFFDQTEHRRDLLEELTYPTLFRKLMSELPA